MGIPTTRPQNAIRPTQLQSISVLVMFSLGFSSLLFHSTRAKPDSTGPGLGPIVWKVTRLALGRPLHQTQSSLCSQHPAQPLGERGTRGSCNAARLGSAVPSRFTRIRLDSAGGFPDGTTQGDRAPGPRGPSWHTASGQAGSSWATSLA